MRNPRLLRRRIVLKRLFVRFATSAFLIAVALPGSLLWAPILWITRYQTEKMVKKGPAWEYVLASFPTSSPPKLALLTAPGTAMFHSTYDEVRGSFELVYGLDSLTRE